MAVVWAGAVSKETAWVGVTGSTTLREVRWLKGMWQACPQAGALFQAREGGGPCPEGGHMAAHCGPHHVPAPGSYPQGSLFFLPSLCSSRS